MLRIAVDDLGAADLLEVIFKHEKIPYERGVGKGCVTFDTTEPQQTLLAIVALWNRTTIAAHTAILTARKIQ